MSELHTFYEIFSIIFFATILLIIFVCLCIFPVSRLLRTVGVQIDNLGDYATTPTQVPSEKTQTSFINQLDNAFSVLKTANLLKSANLLPKKSIDALRLKKNTLIEPTEQQGAA